MQSANRSFMDKLNQAPTSSMKNKIILVIGLFLLVSLVLLGLGFLQSQVMSSVRSYVRGEGLWAKAQKDSVFHILSYAQSRNPVDYQNFLDALKIPQGDKKARMALQADPPQRDAAYQGFLQAGNHPDDIDGMIWFFLYFHDLPYMHEAISIWTRADSFILKLIDAAESVKSAVETQDDEKIKSSLLQLGEINWFLTDLEVQFSLVLSNGARWVRSTLMWVSLVVLGALLSFVLVFARNITRQIDQTEKKLRISERRFLSLYESNIIGILEWHADGRILEANTAFLDMIGYTAADLDTQGLNWRQLTPQEVKQQDDRAVQQVFELGFSSAFEKSFIHRKGHQVPVILGAALLSAEQKKGVGFVLDLSERKRSETELRLAATVFEASSNGIVITDSEMRVMTVNHAYCSMTGSLRDALIGQKTYLFRSGIIAEKELQEIYSTLDRAGHWSGDLLERSATGKELEVNVSLNQVRDRDGRVSHYVMLVTDISERKATEKRLQHLAHHDFLTGLANRSLLDERLDQAIIRANRAKTRIALIYCDLDGFKPINDQYGHAIGDQLLVEISQRLLLTLREADTVARIGGDEFAILLEDVSDEQSVEAIAKKLIGAIDSPHIIKDIQIQVGCSCGIAIYPDHAGKVLDLVRSADQAMYKAKSQGSNLYRMADSRHQHAAEA